MDSKIVRDTQEICKQLLILDRLSKNNVNVDRISIPNINLNLKAFFWMKLIVMIIIFTFSAHLFVSIFQVIIAFVFMNYLKNIEDYTRMYLSEKYISRYYKKIKSIKQNGFYSIIGYSMAFALIYFLVAKFTDKIEFGVIKLFINLVLIAIDFGVNYWFFVGTKNIEVGRDKYQDGKIIQGEDDFDH